MYPNIEQVLDLMEQIAPKRLAEEWDNPGLQIGGRLDPIKKILISLDPTLEAVRAAAKQKAQLLLTHHPLFFKPMRSIERDTYPGTVLWEAIKKEVSIISAHTNLDAAKEGINDQLAELLALKDIRPLGEADESFSADEGMGRLGRLAEASRLTALVETVKKRLGAAVVRVVGRPERMILHVAVVGGSGGGMIEAASRAHADVLITGDIGHHHALKAKDLGLALIDAGHYETEKAALNVIKDRLSSRLAALNWTVEVGLFSEEESPLRYV